MKMICNISNNFFIQKIKDIRKKFTTTDCGPIQILKILKPRVNENFIIPNITIGEQQIL